MGGAGGGGGRGTVSFTRDSMLHLATHPGHSGTWGRAYEE